MQVESAIAHTVQLLGSRFGAAPEVAFILGSGSGGVTQGEAE